MSIDTYLEHAERDQRETPVTVVTPTFLIGTSLQVGFAGVQVPGHQIWELLTLSFIWTSSVTVATRTNSLEYRIAALPFTNTNLSGDNSQVVASFPSNATQAASLAVRYTYSAQGGTGTTNATALRNFIAVPRTVLMPGTNVIVVPSNTQANDSISSVLGQFLAYEIDRGKKQLHADAVEQIDLAAEVEWVHEQIAQGH